MTAPSAALASYAVLVPTPTQTPRSGARPAPRTGRHRAPRRRPRPAGPLLLLAPFAVAMAAVGVAAGHAALGAPFGAAFAGRLWDLTQSLWVMLVAWGPIAAGVSRTNRRALDEAAADDARALGRSTAYTGEEGPDDHDDDGRGRRRRP